MPSLIKRPVSVRPERPDWIVDVTGKAFLVVCDSTRERDCAVAAEIVEALNAYEKPNQEP